jgi:hypothetical protein
MQRLFEIGVGNEHDENDRPFHRKALNELEIDWSGHVERGMWLYEGGRRIAIEMAQQS